jgi:predicted aspartyl protease
LFIEGKNAPSELIAVCSIPNRVKELLKKQEVEDKVVIGVHSLERLGYAVDVITHRLTESPGILMI